MSPWACKIMSIVRGTYCINTCIIDSDDARFENKLVNLCIDTYRYIILFGNQGRIYEKYIFNYKLLKKAKLAHLVRPKVGGGG